jgi:steroid delta-isomerase-like uncharacterized protein
MGPQYEPRGRSRSTGVSRRNVSRRCFLLRCNSPVCVHNGLVEAAVEELVRDFYASLWNRWDDAAVDVLLAEDFTFRGSLGTQTHGRTQWRAYRDAVRQGSSDFHNEVVTLVVEGARAAARLRYTGTHTGQLAGLSPTGRRFSYAGAAFFEASAGQLRSAWVLGDLAGLREQLT